MAKSKPIPDGFTTITPYLYVKGAAEAIDFYKKAFGAKELTRMPNATGGIAHATLQIGSAKVYMCDEMPEMGAKGPKAFGGSPIGLYLYVEDVDAFVNKAVAAGAKTKVPVADQFWGDRWGSIEDPFGHEWQVASRVEEVTPEEMDKRMKAWAAQQGAPAPSA